MADTTLKSGLNPHPFKSEAWHEHNRREIASRPTAVIDRKPLTPDQWDSYRPKPAPAVVVPKPTTKSDLLKIIGPGLGTDIRAARQLTEFIWKLVERIESLEAAQHVNPALAGLEKRG